MNRFEKARYDFFAQAESRGFSVVSDYIDTRTNVKMLCPEGHSNSISPTNFKRGYGCPVCAGVNVKHISYRVDQAKKVHGDKYDYSKWKEGDTAFTKVPVYCKACDEEWITTIDNHVRGRSCPNCRKRISLFNKDHGKAITHNNKINNCLRYLSLAKEAHNNYYSYKNIKMPFLNKSKQTITCPVHGDFQQTFYNHAINGQGCNKCAENRVKELHQFGFDKWVEILSKSHPGVKFHNLNGSSNTAKDKIIAECPTHGQWITSIDSLCMGSRCPACIGLNQKTVYINHVIGTDIIKFGIAIDAKVRLHNQNRVNKLPMVNIHTFEFADFSACRQCESDIKKIYKGVASRTDLQDGWTETANIKDIEDIVKMIKDRGGV